MAIWSKQFLVIPAVALLAACGGETASQAATDSAQVQGAGAPAVEAAAPAAAAPVAGGEVIEIKMSMAGSKAVFEPAEVTAKQGDVLRFVNVDNVHNVSFPADKNANAAGLPAASPFLTTPGQTYDVTVDMQPGTYTFQCDPHVAMGMVGTLTVQ